MPNTIGSEMNQLPNDMDSINIHTVNEDQPAESYSDKAGSYIDSSLAQSIFQDVFAQGENLWGSYFTDGQFVYAHMVRRYIESKYNIECRKLFIFGDITATSLRYDCCATWSYDVACVLLGKEGRLYVIDPRLFNSVVSKDVWMQAHVSPTMCEPYPIISTSELVSGESLFPLGGPSLGYKKDPDYQAAEAWKGYYADSTGCGCVNALAVK